MNARIIGHLSLCPSVIDIYVDSIDANKTLNSYVIKLKCFDDCIKSLALTSYHQVKLVWIPRNQGIRANEKALDEATSCNDEQN